MSLGRSFHVLGHDPQTLDVVQDAGSEGQSLPRILACPFRVFSGVCLRCPEKRKRMNMLPATYGTLDAGLASIVDK